MSIVWACCSSKRSDTISKKTLRTLERGGFKGTLFLVVPHEEVSTYVAALTDAPISVVVQGATKGLVNQRKRVREQWPPGQEIVFIDDDVTNIKIWVEGRLKPVVHLHELADAMFQWAACHDALLWGVYPICNALFMKPRMSLNNAYIVGAFYGIVNDPRLEEPEIDELEDYSRQLSEQAAGRNTVRFNWVGVETRYFANAGGMQQERSPEKRLAAVQAMAERYPTLVKKVERKDGTPDLRFLEKPHYRGQEEDSATVAQDVSADQSTASTSAAAAPALPSPSDPAPL